MKPMPERMRGMPMCQFLSLNFLLLQAMYVLQRRHASEMLFLSLYMCGAQIKAFHSTSLPMSTRWQTCSVFS